MKLNTMKPIVYIWIVLLFSACYDDKGNYNYSEVNELEVNLPKEYSIYLEKDTVLQLEPQLSQTLLENEDNLTFMWLHSTTNQNFYTIKDCDTVGVTKAIQYRFDPGQKGIKYTHYFRLNVFDKVTGIEYAKNIIVTLVKPFTGAWMLLHAKNGQTALGAIQYVGAKKKVSEDAYYEETGKRFQGVPVCLGRMTSGYKPYGGSGSTEWMMFSVVTTEPDESGIYCQWNHFEKMDSMSGEGNILKPSTIGNIDLSKIDCIDGEGNKGGIVLADGQFYQMPKAMKIHKPETELQGEVSISHAAKAAMVAFVYDEKGHRFAYYDCTAASDAASYDPTKINGSENSIQLKLIPERQGLNTTDADPGNVDPGQKMLYIGGGYKYDISNWAYTYAYALAMKGDYCFIYVFDAWGIKGNGDRASFPAYYRFDRPKDLDEKCCFATSSPYSNIIFYASGNSVYRLDFKQTKVVPALIYTHSSGKATKMKFARPGYGAETTKGEKWYEKYEFDVNRSLGIVFDVGDGKNDFVILNLSATGSIGPDSEHYNAKQVYGNFGEIKDFVFI